jgi:hypothetical protein
VLGLGPLRTSDKARPVTYNRCVRFARAGPVTQAVHTMISKDESGRLKHALHCY